MSVRLGKIVVAALVLVAACTGKGNPGAPSSVATSTGQHALHDTPADHQSAAHDDKGLIDGWYEGQTVELFYTKSFFCSEPPASGASTNCELGAPAEVFPRPGPIPTIYAIAAAGGIQVDPLTLACRPGTPCMNHPAMLDASRVLGGGATSIPGVPHSHLITEKRGGWYHTVNIRVRDVAVWNAIAQAKTLDDVRQWQQDRPDVVSADTPTNIFFFISSFRNK